MARKSLNVDVDLVQPILFRLELDEKNGFNYIIKPFLK